MHILVFIMDSGLSNLSGQIQFYMGSIEHILLKLHQSTVMPII